MDPGWITASNEAQRQIPVLRTEQIHREATDVPQNARPVDAEVGHTVLGQEQIQVPIGLEIGVKSMPLLVDLVFVTEDQVGIGLFVELDRHMVQRMGRQQIIVIQQGTITPCGQLQRAVGRRRDMAVLFAENHFDPGVPFGVCLQLPAHPRIRRCIVGDTQLPIGVVLGHHRLNRLGEEALIRVVNRKQYRNEGFILKAVDVLQDRMFIRSGDRIEALDPCLVVLIKLTLRCGDHPEVVDDPLVKERLCSILKLSAHLNEVHARSRIKIETEPACRVHRDLTPEHRNHILTLPTHRALHALGTEAHPHLPRRPPFFIETPSAHVRLVAHEAVYLRLRSIQPTVKTTGHPTLTLWKHRRRLDFGSKRSRTSRH